AGNRERIPGQSHGVSRRDGGARPFRKTLPWLRHRGAADCPRRARSQLLPVVPDRGTAPRRPLVVEAPEGRLAEDPRRARAPAREASAAGVARRLFGTFWQRAQKKLRRPLSPWTRRYTFPSQFGQTLRR